MHPTDVSPKALEGFAIYDQGRCDEATQEAFEFVHVLWVGSDVFLCEGDIVFSEEPLRCVAVRSGGLGVSSDFFLTATKQSAQHYSLPCLSALVSLQDDSESTSDRPGGADLFAQATAVGSPVAGA